MRKGVLFLIFAMIFTMIVPAQAYTTPQSKLPEMPVSNDINGTYLVSVKSGDEWNEIGSLYFGKNPSTETIDVGSYLIGDNPIIKLSQNGGGSAYLDAVLLDGIPAVKANYDEVKVLNKLSKEDLDITPVGEEGVVLEFNKGKSSVLTVVGRIEPVVIGKEPLQFPAENNYKSKDDVEDFYNYTIGNNLGIVTVDGLINEVKNIKPFVKEYSVPGSGHPAGDVYFWLMNDDDNLYITVDATPDNTFDGDKDYAKVYVNTNQGIKEFKVSVPEKTWGNTGFTYTNKVSYEHKVYEFAIPLSEMNAINGEEISIAFVVYGTASQPLELRCLNPDIAYDSDNGMYLSVFEYEEIRNGEGSAIYGDILDNDGNVVISKFEIEGDREKKLYSPTVAYDEENKNFLVVWSEPGSRDNIKLLRASTVKIEKDTDNNYFYIIEGPFDNVSGNEGEVYEEYLDFEEQNPELEYGSNGEFLLAWNQYYFKEDVNTDEVGSHIYGRIINSSNTLQNKNFVIGDGTTLPYDDFSVSYDQKTDAFLVAQTSYNEVQKKYNIDVQVVNSAGPIENGRIGISTTIYYSLPSISFNISNGQFLITWEDVELIKGRYVNLNSELLPEIASEIFTVSTDDEYFSYNPTSYSDGIGNILCVWDTTYDGLDKYYARLRYIDDEGNIGDAFFTDDYEDYRDNLYYDTQIAMSGDNHGKVIIAYDYITEQVFQRSSNNNNNNNNNNYYYLGDIGYRIFGEYEIEPYIEFSNTPFDEIIIGDTIQANIKLYDNEYPKGKEIYENLYYFSENTLIATISNTGLITGASEGETSISAIYDPWAKVEGDKISFSDGMIVVKNPATVIVIPKPSPSLEFDKQTYSVQINKTVPFSVVLKNYGDIKEQNVTNIVSYELGNSKVASISTGGAITGLSVGTTTVSAIYADGEIEPVTAFIVVTPGSTSSSGSSTPARTPIGQILVDNKVIKTLYEEDVINKNNTYTFTADKIGESAKLWLDSGFYNDLAEDYPNKIIKFNWDKGTYTLPLNCEEVLKEIDNSAKKVNILIEKVDDKEIIEAAKDSAEDMGAEIISDLIDFSVYIEKSKGNKDIESLDFYAVRTINELDEINENISTAMKFVENKEVFTFAPSVFDDDFVTIIYRGNGIFTVIENPQTFNDILNHWAKVNIEKLATRNIAFGREDNSFAPNDFVTRAEFAVMITRALGITEEEGSNDFSDVSNEWFAEDIGTAFESELINGRSDGKFYPNEKIQRKDMAVMIQNALEFAGMSFDISNADSVLSMFKDSSFIADYARESTAFCADAEIIMGRDTKNFDPDHNATRAEASAIIERMLRYLNFMN